MFSNIASYEQLPLNIKRKYQTKVGEYLINPQHFNGWDVPIPRIIDNFSKVLTSTYSSLEDKEFLLMHPGNLKSTQLFNFLNEMGIQNGKDKFLESPLIKDFFVNILGFEESDYDLKVSRNHPDLFIYLDTLVEQRNFVAHGRVDEPRISSNELKEKYVPFLKILARVITRILMCELYVMIFAKKSSFSQRFPLDVFSNNIIGIHIGNETIKKGDYVIFGTEKDVKCARVLNIKIGEQDKEKITDIDCDIGLKTDQKINQNHLIFYIVPC